MQSTTENTKDTEKSNQFNWEFEFQADCFLGSRLFRGEVDLGSMEKTSGSRGEPIVLFPSFHCLFSVCFVLSVLLPSRILFFAQAFSRSPRELFDRSLSG